MKTPFRPMQHLMVCLVLTLLVSAGSPTSAYEIQEVRRFENPAPDPSTLPLPMEARQYSGFSVTVITNLDQIRALQTMTPEQVNEMIKNMHQGASSNTPEGDVPVETNGAILNRPNMAPTFLNATKVTITPGPDQSTAMQTMTPEQISEMVDNMRQGKLPNTSGNNVPVEINDAGLRHFLKPGPHIFSGTIQGVPIASPQNVMSGRAYENNFKTSMNTNTAAQFVQMIKKDADQYHLSNEYHFLLGQLYEGMSLGEEAFEQYQLAVDSGEEAKRLGGPSSQIIRGGIIGGGPRFGLSMGYDAYERGYSVADGLLNRPRLAVDLLKKKLDLYPNAGYVHSMVARLYQNELRDYAEAQKHFMAALEIQYSSSLVDADIRMDACALADSYLDEVEDASPGKAKENAQKAQAVIEKALETSKGLQARSGQDFDSLPPSWKGETWSHECELLMRLSRAYRLMPWRDNKEEALKQALRALTLHGQRIENKAGMAFGEGVSPAALVGMAYLELGNYEEGIRYLEQYCSEDKLPESMFSFSGSDAFPVIHARAVLSRAYAAIARREIEQSLRNMDPNRLFEALTTEPVENDGERNQQNHREPDLPAAAREALGKAVFAADEYLNWVDSQNPITRRTDEAKLAASGLRRHQAVVDAIALNALPHPAKAFKIMENAKSKALLELIAQSGIRKKEKSKEPTESEKNQLLAQAASIEQQIASEKELNNGSNVESLQRSLVLVQDKAEHLAENIKDYDREIQSAVSMTPMEATQVRQMLAENNATLLSYWDSNTVAVIGPDVFVVKVLRSPVSAEMIAEYRNALLAQNGKARGLDIEESGAPRPAQEDASLALGQELYRRLVKPVEEYIHTDLVFISPDSALHLLPFHALHDGHQYLVEKHTIAYAPNASILKYCMAKRKLVTGRILAFGNPNLHEAKYQLVHSAEEVKAITDIFPDSRALLGDDATEKAVQVIGGDFDVLHFACHGMVNYDEPQLSCLRLAPDKDNDGYLHSREICDARLNAALVTLSACDSGLGTITLGSEVLGLPRAMMFAGTPSVVASLWKVDDASTAEFMVNFYTGLKTKSKVVSLRDAQLMMIKRGLPPFNWAPFCLYGDYM